MTRFQSLGCWGLAVVHSADPGYGNVYRVDNPKASFIQLGNSLSGGKAGDKFGSFVLFSPHFNLLAMLEVAMVILDMAISTGSMNQHHYLYSLVTPLSVAKMVIGLIDVVYLRLIQPE